MNDNFTLPKHPKQTASDYIKECAWFLKAQHGITHDKLSDIMDKIENYSEEIIGTSFVGTMPSKKDVRSVDSIIHKMQWKNPYHQITCFTQFNRPINIKPLDLYQKVLVQYNNLDIDVLQYIILRLHRFMYDQMRYVYQEADKVSKLNKF